MFRVAFAAALLLLLLPSSSPAAISGSAEPVDPLPALDRSAAWSVAPEGEQYASIADAPSSLLVRFRAVKGATARVLLREPIQMGADVTGLTFLATPSISASSLFVHVLIRDAKGNEFLAYTSSPDSFERGLFFPEHLWRRCRQVRFTTPALSHVNPEPNWRATLSALSPGTLPVRPYTFLGFVFEGDHQTPDTSHTDLYISGIALTSLTPTNTSMYYQFNGGVWFGEQDGVRFGELDPVPSITLGDLCYWLGSWDGRRYVINWEMRDRYDAPPYLAGGEEYDVDPASSAMPFPLQLAQSVAFPVTKAGTYWVRVKVRCYGSAAGIPEAIAEHDYRLYIKKGTAENPSPPAAGDIPRELATIGPGRSLIYGPDENWK